MGAESGTISAGLAGSEVGEKLLREPFAFDFLAASRNILRPGPSTAIGFSTKACLPFSTAYEKWIGRKPGGVARDRVAEQRPERCSVSTSVSAAPSAGISSCCTAIGSGHPSASRLPRRWRTG